VSSPRLAIAIVHYRAPELLRECVRRLRASSLQDFVAVVVDNGSDDALAWLDGLDARIQVVRNATNVGFSAGVNRR
jgi:GT2 family glycosyltransferase